MSETQEQYGEPGVKDEVSDGVIHTGIVVVNISFGDYSHPTEKEAYEWLDRKIPETIMKKVSDGRSYTVRIGKDKYRYVTGPTDAKMWAVILLRYAGSAEVGELVDPSAQVGEPGDPLRSVTDLMSHSDWRFETRELSVRKCAGRGDVKYTAIERVR